MALINNKPTRFEVTAVYEHPEATVDIVLVHGFNGNPRKTWTAQNGVYWPTDLLPRTLGDLHANILVYGYNADAAGYPGQHSIGFPGQHSHTPSDNPLHRHAQTLVSYLTTHRQSKGTTRNPIIWVAHSLGGLLTKRALLHAYDIQDPHLDHQRSIYVSTYGIIFLGTPHNGSNIAAWGGAAQKITNIFIPRMLLTTETVLLKALKKDNEIVQELSNRFTHISQRFEIHMAHENQKTDAKGTKVRVVDPVSAGPPLPGVTYYGIEASHSNMCKYGDEEAPGYRNVSKAIAQWIVASPGVIGPRWDNEDDNRRARGLLDVTERARLYVKPPFIHPETFRPNSYFVGRAAELTRLHTLLTDPRRRAEGTSAVLIQCLPGGGETHLARQYVFQHRGDYPGGVFWVRAKSRQELEKGFWGIVQSEVLKRGVDGLGEEDLRDPGKIVQIARRWLNARSGWLLVLDGVDFESVGLREFVPDARGTSLIYTSTGRRAVGLPEFDNPQLMELGLLTAEQGRELLFLEIGRSAPWSVEDQARALEVVKKMGRLPLMIHATAQNIKQTQQPLARYLQSNHSDADGLDAYREVQEALVEREETAALTLISLLVFFDQNIPFEMLALGLSALDRSTPVKKYDPSHRKASLNNTLSVLIAFALVNRTSGHDLSPTSSRSSKRSFDKQGELHDIVTVHSVVQEFFTSTAHKQRRAQFWLERAAAVWCRSYDEADARIQEDPRPGLPDDYRWYSIHGQKLLQNVGRFEKRYPGLAMVRAQLDERLEKIKAQIEHLSHTVQTNIVTGSTEEHQTSVFDRISATSESDSPTDESRSSQTSRVNSQDDCDLVLVPVRPQGPQLGMPYPNSPVMPLIPNFSDDEDQDTVVLSRSGTQVPGSPRRMSDGMPSPSNSYGWGQSERQPRPHHRVLAWQESRRYHDRGGSWRDSSINDPRIESTASSPPRPSEPPIA
ncbi:protein SERAC1 [Staphylotrichum tortipilum]|uniref:Protein SERAC1 n=1 Tax=Staphylotrichum tortipilum TaxID=2831512 RepID=A0AAN6MGH0_9PEZI|nr:protein SERAC1 [Staphylotrichum longicolle]